MNNTIIEGKKILIIICGSIACYKVLDLIRRLKEKRAIIYTVMTKSAQSFISPLLVNHLSEENPYKKQEDYHIKLSRKVDIIIVAPCTANRIAKIAVGLCSDLAGLIILSSKKVPILIVPAMNPSMWNNPITKNNVKKLIFNGLRFIGPNVGEMAEKNEYGIGRMCETKFIILEIEKIILKFSSSFLSNKNIIVTSGPTYEYIDPIRYFTNLSSGKQGHAIALSLARLGANVTLISGPVKINDPIGVKTIHVETAKQMYYNTIKLLPSDVAILSAGVTDWRPSLISYKKIKKTSNNKKYIINMIKNPDILYKICTSKNRPTLVIGFAAETSNIIKHAKKKLINKYADWIIVNNVSKKNGKSVFGSNENRINIVTNEYIEKWPTMQKNDIGDMLAKKILKYLKNKE